MEITSAVFYVMVAASLLVYWKLPGRFQWTVLLADSLLFYLANASCATLIYVCISIASVYAAARYFARYSSERARRVVLVLTVLLNVGILAVLKYTNLVIHTWNFLDEQFFHVRGLSDVAWAAPLAVSFYTLQLVSYLLDCYWGTAEAFTNPLHLGLYTIYFPLMVSGPICRYDQLGKQLFEEHRFDYDRVKFGLYRIGWGLLKKLAVSNRAAVIADQMWAAPETSSGLCVWIAVAFFLVQLYTDFSGCMDIVLGVSACFGIYLPENFNAPFYSGSMQEFWRRWNITLGTWLKDYIMNPILKSPALLRFGAWSREKFGKKQGKKMPSYAAMFVLWFCMGLWHGGSWKYIIGEGFWFWLVIVSGQILEPVFKKWTAVLHIRTQSALWHIFQAVRTFLLWGFGMLFFRAESFRAGLDRIIAGLHIRFSMSLLYEINVAVDFSDLGEMTGLFIMGISFLAVLIVDFLKYKEIDVSGKIAALNWKWRWILYYALVIVLYMSLDIANQESIYAQF